jgi:hypothetical protein
MIKDLILLVLGAVIGHVLSVIWSLSNMDKTVARIARRRKVKPIPLERLSVTFYLGNRETDTCVIDGNGELVFAPDEVLCRYKPVPVEVPDILKIDFQAIMEREFEKESQSQAHAWNGKMAHIVAFTPSRTADREDSRLLVSMHEAQYFHFLASNAVIAKEFDSLRYASPL